MNLTGRNIEHFTVSAEMVRRAFVQVAGIGEGNPLGQANAEGECDSRPHSPRSLYLPRVLVVGHGESEVAADALASDGLSHGSVCSVGVENFKIEIWMTEEFNPSFFKSAD